LRSVIASSRRAKHVFDDSSEPIIELSVGQRLIARLRFEDAPERRIDLVHFHVFTLRKELLSHPSAHKELAWSATRRRPHTARDRKLRAEALCRSEKAAAASGDDPIIRTKGQHHAYVENQRGERSYEAHHNFAVPPAVRGVRSGARVQLNHGLDCSELAHCERARPTQAESTTRHEQRGARVPHLAPEATLDAKDAHASRAEPLRAIVRRNDAFLVSDAAR
jgi:hypothetical protein